MRPSNRLRRSEQSGQMLVSVIVLLTLMFFIGSAMALAVSSSLNTIAQTNNKDSSAYAAESAAALGLARRATPVYGRPKVGEVLNAPTPLTTPVGCNNGVTGGDPGGNNRSNNRDNGNNGNSDNGSRTNAGNVAVAVAGMATWSYAYEVVLDDGVGRNLVGRSDVGSGQGPSSLDLSNYETITIDHISIPGFQDEDISFEVYRTASGDGSPTGCIGVFAQKSGDTTVTDPGWVSPAPPMCTSPAATLTPLPRRVNRQGALTAATCRVPLATEPDALHMWSAPGQLAPAGTRANPQCAQQALTPPFSPGNRPGTAWGVIGTTSKTAVLSVSLSACDPKDPTCFTSRATMPGVIYYWCHLAENSPSPMSTLYIVNQGGNAKVNPFVVRAAPSGTDCVVTTMGRAGLDTVEAAQLMPGCAWTPSTTQNLWGRVLP